MPFASDGSLTFELVAERYNSDLANILGNLVIRTVAMTIRYFGGTVPEQGGLTALDRELIDTAAGTVKNVDRYMDELRIADAIYEVFTLLRRSNKYIDETMPWVLAKDGENRERLSTVIYNLLESIRISAVLLSCFIPKTAEIIFAQLGTDIKDYDSILSFGNIRAGSCVGEPAPLFARIDEKELSAYLKELQAESGTGEQKPDVPEIAPRISIDSFAKVDLRAALVLECEPVKKSDKLLRLVVDIGLEKRQVVAGIAEFYKPADLIGKKLVLVSNLEPATIRGSRATAWFWRLTTAGAMCALCSCRMTPFRLKAQIAMILFDTHAHYDDKAFDGDRDELIQSLPSEGIGLVLNAGSGEESSAAAVGLAEKYEFIYASAGVHPIEAHDAKEGWQERIIELAGHRKCRAIGEIGLDYHYDFSPRDVQKSVFDQQLSIAESLKLPVIIHQREAFSDTLDILKCHPGVCGVFHCFSGGCETAKTVLDMGFYISLGGTITFKNAKAA